MSELRISATVKRFYGSSAVVQMRDGTEKSAETNSRNKSLVCGDDVILEIRAGGYFIVETEPRRSEFFRTDGFGRRKVVAANVDQILLVIAPLPEPHTRVVDRYWAAARNCEIPMRIVVNKSDRAELHAMEELVQLYAGLGLDIYHCSAKTSEGMPALRDILSNQTSVFVGQSGVGKSSLVNSLYSEAGVLTGDLSEKREEGRHTTTTTDFYDIGNGARVLDSPGIREFGLDHYDQPALEHGFAEISDVAAECRFRNCIHTGTPGCAVEEAVKAGKIDTRRLENYRHLLAHIS